MSTYSKFWPKGGLPGRLHHYTETLVTFEFTSSTPKPHSILFVGGLGDGLATTSYLVDLERRLRPTPWSLFTLTLTSSYSSWGLGHLDRDADEIARCLTYIREHKATGPAGSSDKRLMTLMGHSTGSQNVLHYLSQPNPFTTSHAFDRDLTHILRPTLDGAIMQAPVSDREVIQLVLDMGWAGKTPAETRLVFDDLLRMAREADGLPFDTLLPLALTSQIAYPANCPVSARRFLSLNSPESPAAPREDDLFSSDLEPEQLAKTFGRVASGGLLASKLMVLYSGADQSTPKSVDKLALLERWRTALNAGGRDMWDERSGVIPNASHALSNDDQAPCREDLVIRVAGYLEMVERS